MEKKVNGIYVDYIVKIREHSRETQRLQDDRMELL